MGPVRIRQMIVNKSSEAAAIFSCHVLINHLHFLVDILYNLQLFALCCYLGFQLLYIIIPFSSLVEELIRS